MIIGRKQREVSPAHARRVLVDVGLWTERTPPGEGGGGSGGGSTRDRHAGDTPAPGSGTAGAGEGDGAGTGSSNDLAVLAEAGAGVGVIPWAADVLEAASALGKERSRRASNYEKKPPQVDIGAPAPFGRCVGRPGGGDKVDCSFLEIVNVSTMRHSSGWITVAG